MILRKNAITIKDTNEESTTSHPYDGVKGRFVGKFTTYLFNYNPLTTEPK